MKALLKTLFNATVAPLAGRGQRVVAGHRCKIRWWGLRGRAGRIEIGDDSIVNARILFDSPRGVVRIGNRCYLGASTVVCHTGVTLGDDVIMSWGVTIVDHDSHTLDWQGRQNDVANWALGQKDWSKISIRHVDIRNKVWIGFGVSILKGVTLGEGSVVAAASVVTRDVPPYTLVAGNPARVIRELEKPTARSE
jgi:galactoside O-acetyltransferase